jgi:beta-lactamase regulating signal transducer with metallopeptidase domain
MHTLLGLSSLLPILLGGFLAFGILRRLTGWSRRRDLQLLILAAPVASLGLSVSELYHLVSRICFIRTPPWDYILSMTLPLGMGLVALGGVSLGVVRLALMTRVIGRSSTPIDPALQALANGLSERLGVARPRMLLYAYDRPLALTVGLWQPRIVLSTWMMDHFDRRELEAVLAHELGHVARRDYLLIWLATVLRDAFCYLPTSWVAYRQLQVEKELACDDLVISATNRPLALASALAKTWQYAVNRPSFGLAQPLVGGSQLLESRIERLLVASKPLTSTMRSRLVVLSVGLLVLSVLVLGAAANVAIMLAPLECGPASLIWRLVS